MTNNTGGFYSKRGGSRLQEAVKAQNLLKEPSQASQHDTFSQVIPATNRNVKFEVRYIDSKDIEDICVKSRFNKRSEKHLTKTSVLDLFDDIEEDKMNSVPAYGYLRPDGIIEILAGLRRSFTVKLIPDAKLMILVSADLTGPEQMALSYSSDEYRKPSNVDLAFAMHNYVIKVNSEKRQNEFKVGDELYDELQTVFKKSRGFINEHISFAKFPSELYDLFPDVSMINYVFLRKILTFKNDELMVAALKSLVPIQVEASDDFESIKVKTLTKQKEILNIFKVDAAQNIPENLIRLSELKTIAGASIKASKNGITLTIKKALLDDPLFEQKLNALLNAD